MLSTLYNAQLLPRVAYIIFPYLTPHHSSFLSFFFLNTQQSFSKATYITQKHKHDLNTEKWKLEDAASSSAPNPVARARAVIGQMCATRMHRSQQAAINAEAREFDRVARIQTMMWECEYGIWLTSNSD